MNGPVPDAVREAAPLASAPFRAGKAFQSLGFVYLAQTLVGVSAVVAVMAIKPALVDPMQDPDVIAAMIFSAGVASAAATGLAARWWARPLLDDRTASGLGLWLPSTKSLILWAGMGAALAISYLGIVLIYHPAASGSKGGPLAQAASLGGWPRLAWAILAIFLAPASEELLFRGLLYKGIAASWGPVWAFIVVTGTFVALHVPEAIHYWPSIVAILLISVAALVARLRSGSLVASIALHTAYNTVIVAWVCMMR